MSCETNKSIVCPCASTCDRHGKCCACVAHHASNGNLPACLREPKKA
jgi:hypothetical protein